MIYIFFKRNSLKNLFFWITIGPIKISKWIHSFTVGKLNIIEGIWTNKRVGGQCGLFCWMLGKQQVPCWGTSGRPKSSTNSPQILSQL